MKIIKLLITVLLGVFLVQCASKKGNNKLEDQAEDSKILERSLKDSSIMPATYMLTVDPSRHLLRVDKSVLSSQEFIMTPVRTSGDMAIKDVRIGMFKKIGDTLFLMDHSSEELIKLNQVLLEAPFKLEGEQVVIDLVSTTFFIEGKSNFQKDGETPKRYKRDNETILPKDIKERSIELINANHAAIKLQLTVDDKQFVIGIKPYIENPTFRPVTQKFKSLQLSHLTPILAGDRNVYLKVNEKEKLTFYLDPAIP